MNRASIRGELKSYLEMHGWREQRLCKFPQAFSRNLDVTPIFVPHIIRNSENVYVINGYIGLMNQLFEKYWINTMLRGGESENRNCLTLNIANVPRLLEVSYIHEQTALDELKDFCRALTQLLEEMPHDAEALVRTFQTGNLAGIRLENFVTFGEDQKFSEMKKWVLRHSGT